MFDETDVKLEEIPTCTFQNDMRNFTNFQTEKG